MEPIYITLPLREHREEFGEFCEKEGIKILDKSFLFLTNSIWAMVRLHNGVVNQWMTCTGSEDPHKKLPLEAILIPGGYFYEFYKSIPKPIISSQNTKKHMSNYFHSAVTTTNDGGSVKELVEFKTRIADDEDELRRELMAQIPKEYKIRDCEILVKEVFR